MSRFSGGQYQLTRRAYAKATSGGQEIATLANRGQNGYLTDMTFMPNTTDYIAQPAIVKLLRAPTGFSLMPDGDAYVEALVNIIETMMQSWEGFNRTLNVSTTETQIGKSGEVFHTPSRVARERSNPTSVLPEKYGMPCIRFLDDYIRILIGDPDVGHPLLSGISDKFVDQLADMYSFDILIYEPDPTFKFVNNSILMTNVFPHQQIGEWVMKRTLQEEGEKREYSLTWTGVQKVGYAVDQLAQKFMDATKVTTIDPSMAPNYINGMLASVAKVGSSAMNQIEELKNSQVAI